MEKINQKIKKLFKKDSYLILFFAVISLVVFSWFKKGTILYFHDEIIPLNVSKNFVEYFNTWRETVNFGVSSSGGLPKLISFLPFLLLKKIGLHTGLIEAVIYYFLSFISLSASFFLFKKIWKNRSANFIGSLFYLFNVYNIFYIFRVNYVMTRMWFLAFLPLVILGVLKFYSSEKRSRGILLFSLIGIIPSFANIAYFLVFLLTLLIFSIYFYFNNEEKKDVKIFYKKLFYLISLVILLNSFWLLPLIITSSDQLHAAASIGLDNSLLLNAQGASPLTVFNFLNLPPTHEQFRWYIWQNFYTTSSILLIILSVITVIVIFSSLWSKKTNKNYTVLFFTSVLCFLIILITGVAKPFGQFYFWLFKHLPGFVAFRDPYKFGDLFLLIESILFGIGLSSFSYKIKYKKYNYVFIGIVIFLQIVVIPWPMWLGKVFPKKLDYPSSQIVIPQSYKEVSSILDRDETPNYRILSLPIAGVHNSSLFNEGENGYKSTDLIRNLSAKPVLHYAEDINLNNYLDSIAPLILVNNQKAIDILTQRLEIKYIILDKNFNYGLFDYPLSFQELRVFFDNDSSFVSIYDSGDLVLYQNKNIINPEIYLSQNIYPTDYNFSDSLPLNFEAYKFETSDNTANIKKTGSNEVSLYKDNKNDNYDFFYLKNSLSLEKFFQNNFSYLVIQIEPINNGNLEISTENSEGLRYWLKENVYFKDSQQYLIFPLNQPNDIKTLRINITNSLSKNKKGNYGVKIKNIFGVRNDVLVTTKLSDTHYLPLDSFVESGEIHLSNGKMSFIDKINDYKYKFKLITSNKQLIVLGNQFSNGWSLYLKNNKRYKISSTDHILINGFENGWWIDPSEFPEDFKNSDGNYQFEVVFTAQCWFYVGLIISGITFLGCIGYLIYNELWCRKRQEQIEHHEH